MKNAIQFFEALCGYVYVTYCLRKQKSRAAVSYSNLTFCVPRQDSHWNLGNFYGPPKAKMRCNQSVHHTLLVKPNKVQTSR